MIEKILYFGLLFLLALIFWIPLNIMESRYQVAEKKVAELTKTTYEDESELLIKVFPFIKWIKKLLM